MLKKEINKALVYMNAKETLIKRSVLGQEVKLLIVWVIISWFNSLKIERVYLLVLRVYR